MITDELREWARNHTVNCSDNRIALVAIANRIDAEHRKALERVAAMVDEPWYALRSYSEGAHMIHPTYGFGLFKPLATDRLGLTPIEEEVYGLHREGYAVPQIAARLGIAESEVSDIIVFVWREDSQLFLNMRRRKTD